MEIYNIQCNMQVTTKKIKKKKHQEEVIELFLAKLATLCILFKGLKNFPIQLIYHLTDSSCKDFALC